MSNHVFSLVPHADIPRSRFDRSHGVKTTLDSGYLVPIMVDEVLPGDTFNLKPNIFARLSTMVAPVMDNIYLDVFAFFVPSRLVWDNFQKFMGEKENPSDSTDFLIPTIKAPVGGFPVGSLADYFGIPTGVENLEVNALPFRAYNLVWNEWYRDQNLQDSVMVEKGDIDKHGNYKVLRRCKKHDYFTSCLPFPQKGAGVELPLGQTASIKANGPLMLSLNGNTSTSSFTKDTLYGSVDSPIVSRVYDRLGPQSGIQGLEYAGGLQADLSEATAITINSLRQAFQIQRMLEKDARGGTRYTEILRSHFGVTSPDARLQRPELLSVGSKRVTINSVEQTSATDNTSPQGNLTAYGFVASTNGGFTKSFVEHGYILYLVNIRADLSWQQGLNKMWSRQTRDDFYWPSYAHLGEQAVLNREIFAQGNAQDDEVFGYQERYGEYRYCPSIITGKMRSTDPQSLDVWHLASKYDSLPKLNAEFIEDNPPIDRAIAVQDEPQFLLDAWFDMDCIRPMPLYGVPGLIDHF